MPTKNEIKSEMAWGLDINKNFVHIKDVERGANCNCFCIDCSAPLIAKKGKIKEHHFAHKTKSNCQGESVLHKVAKKVVVDGCRINKSISIPNFKVSIGDRTLIDGNPFNKIWELFSGKKTKKLKLLSGEEEKYLGDLIADVYVEIESLGFLAIEIFVTHAKGIIEKSKFEKKNLNCIEIDLSQLCWNSSYKEIENAIFNESTQTWVHFSRSSDEEAEDKSRFINEFNSLNHKLHNELKEKFIESYSTDKSSLEKIPLTHSVEKEINGFKYVGKATYKPNFSEVIGTFKEKNDGWQTLVKTTKGVEVPLSLAYESNIGYEPKGVFHVECKDDYGHSLFTLRLANPPENLVNWISNKANEDLQEKISVAQQKEKAKKTKLEKSIKGFRSLDDFKKIEKLCHKMKICPPKRRYKINPLWNTPDPVWSLLILQYRICKVRHYEQINTLEIASDSQLQKFLGYSLDNESCEKRSKLLFFWFKRMAEKGYLRHLRKFSFRVDKNRLWYEGTAWENIFHK